MLFNWLCTWYYYDDGATMWWR